MTRFQWWEFWTHHFTAEEIARHQALSITALPEQERRELQRRLDRRKENG